MIYSPDTDAGSVEIFENDTLPVKTMTVLQSARPSIGVEETQRQSVGNATHKTIDVAISGQRSGDSDVHAFLWRQMGVPNWGRVTNSGKSE